MAHRQFDEQMAALDALKGRGLDADGRLLVKKMLGNRSNLIVGKAARLAEENALADLLPDLLAAYDRFFIDAAKTDPKCWAKEALAKALVKLEHRSKDTFLRGMRHHQMEPSWGPPVDTAGTLRATCAHALVDCPGIPDAELLLLLIEPLTDVDKAVRIEAARAIGNVGGTGAVLILRLRAQLGAVRPDIDTPEVLGAVYASLLSLEDVAAIPLVAAVLKEGDDLAAEAALALSDLHKLEALAPLIARLREGADSWFGGVLLSAIALTRMPEAFDFLIGLISNDAREAAVAIEAIGRTAPSADLRARVQRAVEQADSPRLLRAFKEHLPEQKP